MTEDPPSPMVIPPICGVVSLKVHPSHGCLYIPYDSEEVKIFAYEVLSRRMEAR